MIQDLPWQCQHVMYFIKDQVFVAHWILAIKAKAKPELPAHLSFCGKKQAKGEGKGMIESAIKANNSLYDVLYCFTQ